MRNLGQMLEETCRNYSDHIFLIHENSRLTYRQFNEAVNALAQHFMATGIKKNDKIAIMLPNCPEFLVSYFAVQKVGAVAVTLNILSTAYELKHLLGNSDARIFITVDSSARRFEEIKEEIPLCREIITTLGMDCDSQFMTIIRRGIPEFEMPDIDLNDPAVMIYTAGLTGKPLGAILTHKNLLTQSELLKWFFDADYRFRGMAVIPFFHSFGAVANMLAIIRIGASVVLLERFTLDSIFQAIVREGVTYTCAVPRLFLGMLFHKGGENYDLSSLKFCVTGGAPMPPEFIPLFKEKFGATLVEGYGLTEASPVCTVTRLDLPLKPGSIGTVVAGTEARIVDPQGVDVPVGTVGELIVRGDNIMKGYYKDDEATHQVIRDGWLHTGDLARMDDDGYIFLAGRMKRMIITSGFNVYPREVELALEMHPAVLKAKVLAKEDLMRGEIVKAEIVRRPGAMVDEKEIMRHCRSYLSSYKHPREVEFVENIES
ncbi:MAG: Long-chain acyl-CoA synthetase [Syntrophus sp. SKADARSKE-3]|nr:Long-chain acyl-CoA synthetase [Syntrophus sp. SKADARSKE-3]